MGKPTYEELFKSYMRCEEEREELILENDYLKDKINSVIQYIDKYGKTIEEIAYRSGTCEDSLQEILDILGGEINVR